MFWRDDEASNVWKKGPVGFWTLTPFLTGATTILIFVGQTLVIVDQEFTVKLELQESSVEVGQIRHAGKSSIWRWLHRRKICSNPTKETDRTLG